MKVLVQRPGGSWLVQNYDKLALIVGLSFLLVSSAILAARAGVERKAFRDRFARVQAQEQREAAPLDETVVSNLARRIANPYQAQPEARRFMVGDLRVASIPDGAPIPYNAAKDPFSGKEQPPIEVDPDSDGDGIPDKYELAFNLNPFDPTDAAADADGDGYSNYEEYLAGTDPNDPTSFPPPAAKLRLVRTVTDPFRFVFAGISGDRFQLNTRGSERTYFVSLGSEVEGFKVAAYEQDAPGGPTLVLQRGEQSFRLVRGRQITDEARTAFLILLLDGSRYRVRLNDTIVLRDVPYKVIDIRDDRVVLRDEQTGKTSTVGMISPDERARLSGSGPEPSASPPATGP